MKNSNLIALSIAALLAAGSAYACPKKDKSPGEGIDGEGVYEVADKKDGAEGERPRRGERDGDGEREGRRQRGERPKPFTGLELTEDQKEQVKEIMGAAKEKAVELMEETKAKKEAGEEIDRDAVREQMHAIREAAFKDVYDNVLTDAQRAEVDERRAEMEKRRAERGEKDGDGDGDRPRRRRGDENKDKGGDLDL